jgi:hypothetical protein
MGLNVRLISEKCPHCGRGERIYSACTTHNLTNMASEAGIYEKMWRPEEAGIVKAKQLIEPLEKGLVLMKSDPWRFKKHNPNNGWGSYDGFVEFVSHYLHACKCNPEAEVEASR